jgi:hypothetical protein
MACFHDSGVQISHLEALPNAGQQLGKFSQLQPMSSTGFDLGQSWNLKCTICAVLCTILVWVNNFANVTSKGANAFLSCIHTKPNKTAFLIDQK